MIEVDQNVCDDYFLIVCEYISTQFRKQIPFFSIQQDTYPFLVLSDSIGTRPWDYGQLFELRLTSKFIRLTARGMQFSTLVDASRSEMPWEADVTCTPTPHALCREGAGLVYFPDDVVDMPYDLSIIPTNSVLERFPTGTCHGYSGRRLAVSDTQYEVSLCDLLTANMDILLDTLRDELRWRVDNTQVTEYIFVSVACVYFMSCISANVVRFSGHAGFEITMLELGILFVNVLYVALNMFMGSAGSWFGGMRYLLTVEDVTLATLMLVYVVCESCVVAYPVLYGWVSRRKLSGSTSVVSGVSVYTALIMLLTLRVHYTFDNPYIQVLVVMFGTRTFLKISSLCKLDYASLFSVLVIVLDVACFCAQLALAVGPAADNLFDAVLSQVTITTISMLLATAVEVQHGL